MTPDQIAEMLDLYLDDELPLALRHSFDAYLDSNPGARAEVHALRSTIGRLQAASVERPDPWFVERTLDSILHENAAQTTPARLLRQ